MQALDFVVQGAGDVAALAITALLANQIEKVREALTIAQLLAEDLRKDLATKDSLQVIVDDGDLARQSAFKREGAQNPSKKTVERTKSEKRKLFHELTQMLQTPLRCEARHFCLLGESVRLPARGGGLQEAIEDRIHELPGSLAGESQCHNVLRGNSTFEEFDIARRQPMCLS